MQDEERPPSLDQLERRIEAARERKRGSGKDSGPGERRGRSQTSGLGIAWRIISELVAGVAVGVGIGWGLDLWLGTRPWLMVAFLFLGMAAGCYNVYRVAQGYEAAIGNRQKADDEGKNEG